MTEGSRGDGSHEDGDGPPPGMSAVKWRMLRAQTPNARGRTSGIAVGNALNALQDKVRALEANLAGPSSSDSSSEGGSEDEEGGGMRRPGRLGARGGAARGQA